MIGAPNSLNLNCKVRVMKEAPGPSVSEEIADILTNYNIDSPVLRRPQTSLPYVRMGRITVTNMMLEGTVCTDFNFLFILNITFWDLSEINR